MHPAETLGMLRCCSQLEMPKGSKLGLAHVICAVQISAPAECGGTPRLRDGPSGSPGPGQSRPWQRAPLRRLRALALGEAENNQSRQQGFDSLLLVLITQECLVCGHCSAF